MAVNTSNLPYLVVGQGIAGSMVAWFLEKANQPFFIIDNQHATASSQVAAGIINPITGRRFVKSWLIDTFVPFSKKTYQAVGQAVGTPLWEEYDIIRFFADNAEGNNWLSKTTWEGYDAYLKKEKSTIDLGEFIIDNAGSGSVIGAKVDLPRVTNALREYFHKNGKLITDNFAYQQLKVHSDSVQYQKITAQKVIFCEGFKACENPWFRRLPFESAKGEVLLLKIPNLPRKDIIKKHYFLVPQPNDLWWFGSNYEWDDLTLTPTEAGKDFLIDALAKILKTKYEIVDHLAAVRPVLKDRRPVLGLHPYHPAIAILNGLGTKGTSIAPFCAHQLVDYLVNGVPIPENVATSRFEKLLKEE